MLRKALPLMIITSAYSLAFSISSKNIEISSKIVKELEKGSKEPEDKPLSPTKFDTLSQVLSAVSSGLSEPADGESSTPVSSTPSPVSAAQPSAPAAKSLAQLPANPPVTQQGTSQNNPVAPLTDTSTQNDALQTAVAPTDGTTALPQDSNFSGLEPELKQRNSIFEGNTQVTDTAIIDANSIRTSPNEASSVPANGTKVPEVTPNNGPANNSDSKNSSSLSITIGGVLLGLVVIAAFIYRETSKSKQKAQREQEKTEKSIFLTRPQLSFQRGQKTMAPVPEACSPKIQVHFKSEYGSCERKVQTQNDGDDESFVSYDTDAFKTAYQEAMNGNAAKINDLAINMSVYSEIYDKNFRLHDDVSSPKVELHIATSVPNIVIHKDKVEQSNMQSSNYSMQSFETVSTGEEGEVSQAKEGLESNSNYFNEYGDDRKTFSFNSVPSSVEFQTEPIMFSRLSDYSMPPSPFLMTELDVPQKQGWSDSDEGRLCNF